MIWPFKGKTVEDHLNATKTVKIHGMKFKIKRVNILDHCSGAKVCAATYDTYKVGNAPEQSPSASKMKSHFIDVLMAGVVYPELSRKQDDGKLPVENLLTDWDLTLQIYGEIISYTYGKKNLTQLISHAQS
jgi:hypothetical protein